MNHNPIKVGLGFIVGTPFLAVLLHFELNAFWISLIQLVFYTGLYSIYDKIIGIIAAKKWKKDFTKAYMEGMINQSHHND